jgi:hypothetical protein
MIKMNEIRLVTGVCCQWLDSGSLDSEVLIETFVLRRKFSGVIATEQLSNSSKYSTSFVF